MASEERVRWAHLFGVVGGALLLAQAAAYVLFAFFWGVFFSWMGEAMASAMGGFFPTPFVMFPFGMTVGSLGGLLLLFAAFEGVLGALALLGSRKIRSDPPSRSLWGGVLVATGIVSWILGGGFLLGAAFTVLSGLLALLS